MWRSSHYYISCLLAVLLLLGACEKELKYDTPVLVVSFNTLNTNFKKAAAQNAISAINSLYFGYSYSSSADIEDQAVRIDSMLALGCDALVLMPQNSDLFSADVIKRVNELGIPLICFGEKPDVDDVEYAAFVTGDDASAGLLAAAFIGDTLKRSVAATKSVLLMTVPSEKTSHERISAFRYRLSDYPDFSILGKCEVSSYDRAEAKKSFSAWIHARHESARMPDAIYAQDDDVALGVLDVIESLALEGVTVIVGCGGSKEFLSRIKNSSSDLVLASAYYTPEMMNLCIDIATNILLYGEYPDEKDILVESAIINKANVDEYYNEASVY